MSNTKLRESFSATIERVSGLEPPPRLVTLIEAMQAASAALLEEWGRNTPDGSPPAFDRTHHADSLVTGLILGFLRARPDSRDDAVRGEELQHADPRESSATHVWLMDAIDNTDSFLRGRTDFGSALMVWEKATGLIVGSLFVTPATGDVYLSTGDAAWHNGIAMRRLTDATFAPARVAVVRRPRRGFSPEAQQVEQQYEAMAGELRGEGCQILEGQAFTALDILSLAETGSPSKFLYYAKPWDLLIAASAAYALGATVTIYPGRTPLFPLRDAVFARQSRDRMLVLIERPQS
jgi:fructose-1,6-bisphosphatase/inositol monophosphatase family enzyme